MQAFAYSRSVTVNHTVLKSHEWITRLHHLRNALMLSYPYIEDLFTAVLAQSEAIKGRFYTAPAWGSELNASNLEQLVDESLGGNKQLKVGPLALMMPPVSSGDYTSSRTEDQYPLTMLFLKQQGVTSSGAVQAISTRTGVTTHRAVDDWHDMKRVGISFVRALTQLIKDKGLSQYFYISQKARQRFVPITGLGNDKWSGVKLEMTAVMNVGCAIEDYASDFATHITIPTTDSHPKHAL